MKFQKITAPLEKTRLGKFLCIKRLEDEILYFIEDEIIFSHQTSDINVFKQFICQIHLTGLVKQTDLSKLFCINSNTIKRWIKKYNESSIKVFHNDKRRGHSHKLTPEVLVRIQSSLNKGIAVNKIAKVENISEGSIRYAIKSGKLKRQMIENNIVVKNNNRNNIFDTNDTFESTVLQKDCNRKISL